ncbi:MAG: ankyrin repeat domain-containing protein, partial [Limnohabitans sp.]
MFINYFKKQYKYIVYIGLFVHSSFSFAGSYEDFFSAIKNDEVKVISSLFVRGFDPNTVDLNGEPAILNTLRHGSLKSFELIAKHPKLKLNVFNSHGESALMLLCLKGELELVKM